LLERTSSGVMTNADSEVRAYSAQPPRHEPNTQKPRQPECRDDAKSGPDRAEPQASCEESANDRPA
jgi:hypothetical protein